MGIKEKKLFGCDRLLKDSGWEILNIYCLTFEKSLNSLMRAFRETET